jgi:DNA-binding beta-propeller fold protein YncE
MTHRWLLALALLLSAAPAEALDQPPLFLQRWGTRGSGDGQFWIPWDVAVDGSGAVYVTDFSTTPGRPHRVQKFSASGAFLARWGTTEGSAPGQFDEPRGIAIDGNDTVYVCDSQNQRIQKFTTAGALVGEIPVPGASIYDLALDGFGHLYVCDLNSQTVRKLDRDGAPIASWGGAGMGPGQFQDPWSVAVAPSGDVYVADRLNHRVQRFDPSGGYLGAIDTPGTGPGQLTWPRGVAVDPSGNLYVTDQLHRVQMFDAQGAFVWQFGSEGILNGQFEFPTGMAIDRTGVSAQLYYVVDQESNRIQKLGDDLTPVVPTSWGRIKALYQK